MANVLSNDQIRSLLDGMLHEHKRISQAPTLTDLWHQAKKEGVELEVLLAREASVQYKSAYTDGSVYLIQNPICWQEGTNKGVRTRVRPAPVRIDGPKEFGEKRAPRRRLVDNI